ncbi:DUF1273 domain-containing protein [Bacillus sp. Bva_UNVM-123]|uniref:DUF1273 domain-containing protein n=1 Tax=Bacillus sp. Bva_UNVM-123 TaxID=2829798 RepID=UPI00391F9C95
MAKVAIISGYKPYEIGIFKNNDPAVVYIKKALKNNLLALLENGLEWVLISGQLGTELWAAEVVFDLQLEGYADLQLAVITPFLDQEESWNEVNKEWYESILAQADFIDSVSHKRYENPSQFRLKNQFFLEKSNALLMFYDPEKEGSPKYLYETARSHQEQGEYDIRLIDFYELQLLVEEEQMNQNDDVEN